MPDIVWIVLGILVLLGVVRGLIVWALRSSGGPRVPEPEQADRYIEALELDEPEPEPETERPPPTPPGRSQERTPDSER